MPDPTLVIEAFADVTCPFTHVGLRRLVGRRSALGRRDVVFRIRAWPLEEVNHQPLDPSFIAEEVAAIRAQVAPDLFVGFDEAAFPSTSMPAFALAAAAYRRNDALGEAVSLELRDLLFEQGLDIADDELIARVAAAHGLSITDSDRDSVTLDHSEGGERGVVGSPHFFTPAGGFFCPALDVSRDRHEHLNVRGDEDGLAEFLTACTL